MEKKAKSVLHEIFSGVCMWLCNSGRRRKEKKLDSTSFPVDHKRTRTFFLAQLISRTDVWLAKRKQSCFKLTLYHLFTLLYIPVIDPHHLQLSISSFQDKTTNYETAFQRLIDEDSIQAQLMNDYDSQQQFESSSLTCDWIHASYDSSASTNKTDPILTSLS